jgi:hypothetical protein
MKKVLPNEAKAKGGLARAEALSPEKRKAIARRAAVARWGERPMRATHKGSLQADFGIDVDCYVLDDEQKTAVISQRGMAALLGLGSQAGNLLRRFLGAKKIAPYVGAELEEKLENPLVFAWSPPEPGARNPPPAMVHGYDVTNLIDVCNVVIRAHDENKPSQRPQPHIVKQAHIILNASAKAGIKGLVYALAGYDATKAEVIAAFKQYVREEARDYEKEFPDQLYGEWYRLYKLPKPERNKPWKFKHLTVGHVYVPLARSNGAVLQLTRARRAKSGERWSKLHQFLSEIGVKALRMHLGQLLGIARLSDDKGQYERNFEKVFGKQLTLPGM